jgi:integrase/recombinase XerC
VSDHRLITAFLTYIESEKQLSAKTCESYEATLKDFAQFLSSQSIEHWSQVSHPTMRQFVARLHRQGLTAKSITQKLSALRSFFNYLCRSGQLSANPVKGLRGPKVEKRLPKVLEVDEISHFLNTLDGDDFIAVRDRAIMELFYSSGVRLSELQGLSLNDFDRKDATLRVTGKGRKTRLVPIGSMAMAAINDWLKHRASLSNADPSALFVTQQGRPLKVRSIQARLEFWGKKLGLSSRLHPHKLRHSCASHFLESSSDLRAVQELLGHANLSTTQVYTHLDFQYLAKVYDAAHPRARKKS